MGRKRTTVRIDDEQHRAKKALERELFLSAKHTLGLNGVELAKLLNIAPKTAWRWLADKSGPTPHHFAVLALHVQPRDPVLAERMHAQATTTLTGWGRPPPPPLPSSAAIAPGGTLTAPTPASKLHVEATVYAACKAGNAAPRAVVPMLRAAVRRARELGVTLEDIERELAPPPKPAK